jgi:glycosyltransferase involved in cell wall biosynthesis
MDGGAVKGSGPEEFRLEIFPDEMPAKGRRLSICIVTFELVGFWHNGGIGTVSTGLAELLAAAGHDVTVAFTRADALSTTQFDAAAQRYRAQGIKVVPLSYSTLPPLAGPLDGFTAWERYAVYQWLSRQSFDVVHGSEHLGELAYCIAAKRLGIAFLGTQFVVGCHGPSQWVIEANEEVARDMFWLWADAAERFCVRHADLAWAPSRYLVDWMLANGFELPRSRTFLQTNCIPNDLGAIGSRTPAPIAASERRPVHEIVLFGRLEPRKGVKLFLDALQVLGDRLSGISATFMGRIGQIDGRPADSVIDERAARLPISWRILSGYDRAEALGYVTAPGRLCVLASPVDNSPCAVYELLELQAPFIACRGGGIPELIATACHDDTLFEYTVSSLAARLVEVIERGATVPKPATGRMATEQKWVAMHARLAAQPIAAGRAPRNPTAGSVTTIISYDGSPAALDATLASLRTCGSGIGNVYVIESERRAILPREAAPGVARLSLDRLGHAGVLEAIATGEGPCVVLLAGVCLNGETLARLGAAVTDVDAVVPFAWVPRFDGARAVAPHFSGALAWSVLHGAAQAGGILSARTLDQLRRNAHELPGTNVLIWFDAAVLAGLEVIPLAEPLLHALAANRLAHQTGDERARLSLCADALGPAQRLLIELAYGLVKPHSASLLSNSDAAATINATAASYANELKQYQMLLASRSYRFGKRIAAIFDRRVPATPGEPATLDEVRRAKSALLQSPAWDAGAPVRLVSRWIRARRRSGHER